MASGSAVRIRALMTMVGRAGVDSTRFTASKLGAGFFGRPAGPGVDTEVTTTVNEAGNMVGPGAACGDAPDEEVGVALLLASPVTLGAG